MGVLVDIWKARERERFAILSKPFFLIFFTIVSIFNYRCKGVQKQKAVNMDLPIEENSHRVKVEDQSQSQNRQSMLLNLLFNKKK